MLNETVNLYRYFDATRMAEYLYACVDATIERELQVELETVSAFAHARKAVDAAFDLPEKQKNLFLKLCWQGNGKISNGKRKSQFSMFEDSEMDALERLVVPYFEVISGEDK